MTEVVQKGGHLALLLDEAQQMDAETIEGLRSLCNIGAERHNYATLVLVGQSGVRARIESQSVLASRLATTLHLEPLTFEETSAYLRHRLNVAGFEGPTPFSPEALTAIFELTCGVPRALNRLCKMTLRQCLARKMQVADGRCVRDAATKTGVAGRWPDSCLLSG